MKGFLAELEAWMTRHISNLERAEAMSKNLINNFEKIDSDNLLAETDNRLRLFKVVEYSQSKIEELLKTPMDEELREVVIEKIKKWEGQFQELSKNLLLLDRDLVSRIAKRKEDLGTQIRDTFENRSKLQGYNLQDTRK